MPGFAPAGEPLFFREKWPKPLTPRLALGERTDANLKRAVQLAGLKQGPPAEESVPPLGQPTGVGQQRKPRQVCVTFRPRSKKIVILSGTKDLAEQWDFRPGHRSSFVDFRLRTGCPSNNPRQCLNSGV
ncbi:hypothetical protein [Nitrospira sp.]|uniref:hypothetical protein n=1 Tax=Nitrospira sp. TaxID=70125 RepID=UPI003FCC413F